MPRAAKANLDLSASCACGAVTVGVKGPVYSMFMCSCEDCQKASGTGHSTVAVADAAAVSIRGETRSFTRPSDSGATFTRWFCPECGTPLYGESSRAPDVVMLPVGLFGRNAGWFVPSQLIFARSHRDWDLVDAGLPRHATYRTERGP